MKTYDGKFAVVIKGGESSRGVPVDNDYNHLMISKLVSINTKLLYDEELSFTVEAEVLVEMKLKEAEDFRSGKSHSFREEIKSIFNDEERSDVLVKVGGQEFNCHKAILRSRLKVFKNTLGPNTLESDTNTIVIKEAPSQAVEDMLKYMLGDIPEDESLTRDQGPASTCDRSLSEEPSRRFGCDFLYNCMVHILSLEIHNLI